jgi:O-acetyl-ADP-ribose deacetylase (regulator of RNase III)
MLKEINGNIFDTDCAVIGHGVNCKGGFNSGIAGQIKRLFPNVREEYLSYHENVGWALGDVQLVGTSNVVLYKDKSFIIANCATQKDYGREDKLYANYHAIERICLKLRHFCKEEGHTLALPRIGCGLANGEWNTVREIYDKVFHDMEVKVYYV